MFITASDLTGSSFSIWICFTARLYYIIQERILGNWHLVYSLSISSPPSLEYMEVKGYYWHGGKLSWYQIVWGPLVCNINSLLTQTPCFQSPGRCWECLSAEREWSSSASLSQSSSPERRHIDTRPSASTTTLASRKYWRWGQFPFLKSLILSSTWQRKKLESLSLDAIWIFGSKLRSDLQAQWYNTIFVRYLWIFIIS